MRAKEPFLQNMTHFLSSQPWEQKYTLAHLTGQGLSSMTCQ